MNPSRQPNNSSSGDSFAQDPNMLQVQSQTVNENYQEALQELLMEGTNLDFGESLSAPPELNQNAGFLSPMTALNASHNSPYTHLSDGYENFSDYTTPGFGDPLSDILSSMGSLDENQDNTSNAETFGSEVMSESTSKGRNSSLGDSVTHPATRLLSPVLTNTPSPRSQQALSRSSTLNDVSAELDANQSQTQPPGPTSAAANSGSRNLPAQFGPNALLPSSRRGVNPEARNNLNQTTIPSIDEQAKERELAETKAGVEQWLTTTNVSEMGSPSELKSREGSHEQSASVHHTRPPTLGVHDSRSTATLVPETRSTPGPGLYLKEEGEDESDEGGEDEEDVDEEDENEREEEQSFDAQDAESTPPAPYQSDGVRPTPSDASAGPTPSWAPKPWADSPFDVDSGSIRGQPLSSNAAIARFERRARDIETASQTATIASSFRRRSLESLFSAANISVVPPSEADTDQAADRGREKRPGLFGRILPKRSNSNLRKRKESREGEDDNTESHTRKESQGSTSSSIKRVSSWARPKSPSLGASSNTPPRLSAAGRASTNLTISTGPWSSVTNVIRRARSRSDLSQGSALAQQWRSQGGPPVANLRPSEDVSEQATLRPDLPTPRPLDRQDSDLDGDNDGEHTPTGLVEMPMSALGVPSAPTSDAFKSHASAANPHIELYMLERVTSEQLKRYRRLVEARLKHTNQVKKGNCPAKDFCDALGGQAKLLAPRRTGPDSDGSAVTFYINRPGQTTEQSYIPEDDSIPASFPEGIPPPPAGVHRLPAEFECPLCFQVKKILKPSDWTKHVHEDLQPFTCSFPDCGEPKSFKRKADWVRHENERHRQLEKWICNFPDCHHTCYRKDNFVQHLVREHRLPEPRSRTSRPAGRGTTSGQEQSQVALLIETCRHDTARRPDEEPCRFCGNFLTTWKKLSAHLAKHMEQISLPVLALAHQANLDQNTLASPIDQELGNSRQASMGVSSNQVPEELSSMHSGYGYGADQDLQPQQSIDGYANNLAVNYSTLGYPSQPQQLNSRIARPISASFPGTRNLPRDLSPYGDGGMAGDSTFLSADSYAGLGQQRLFSTSQGSFDNLSNPSPVSHGHNAPSTYPPPFLTAPTSQPQAQEHLSQSSLYPHAPIFTNSPTLDSNFSPDNFSAPPNSMPSLYQYQQQGIQSSQSPYSDHGTGSYSSHQTPQPAVGGQYARLQGDLGSTYPSTASGSYSAAMSISGQNSGHVQNSQGVYLSSSPSDVQGFYTDMNSAGYGAQSGVTGQQQQGQGRTHQQQQYRYY